MTYLEVTIPERLQADFKVWTRPLWYEELAQYFHVGINEAAEALRICPSAIKRICRRHGLNRWPHRRISSISRNIINMESKLEACLRESNADADVVATLQADIMENMRNRILSRCNLGAPDGSACGLDDDLLDEDKIYEDAGSKPSQVDGKLTRGLYTPNYGAVSLNNKDPSVGSKGSPASADALDIDVAAQRVGDAGSEGSTDEAMATDPAGSGSARDGNGEAVYASTSVAGMADQNPEPHNKDRRQNPEPHTKD